MAAMENRWIPALLLVLTVTVGSHAVPHVGAHPGSCRLVCDPFQAQGITHDLGASGLVIPLSGPAGGGAPGAVGPPGKAGPPGPAGPPGQGIISKGSVAFHVALREEFKGDQVLKFTNVITNLGGDYDPSTGKFTCRTAGVYYFSYHILKSGHRVQVDLIKGQKVVASAVALDLLHTDTAANSAVLQLDVRDQVFVRLQSSDKTLQDSDNCFSTFSGHLLYEM